MTARALMVWGCTSDAGKSFLATALCRWFSDRGLRVAPFKAQNMSNNARVARGGEMGCAQWLQAKAARREPEVRFNPVLLKPERDTRSQVVVLGQVDSELTEMDWRGRSPLLWDRARPALRELMEENDLVVIEGAGSPAEINLADVDYVNLETARESQARCLLVSDIDRGGAFAHLFGTWSLLPSDLRPRVGGFVLNKFRGDAALLAPGPQELLSRTGVPVLGVLPRIRHDLPDEDAVALEHFPTCGDEKPRFRVGLVAWPRISNFDEFRRLGSWPGVELSLVREHADLQGLDILVLPGSKNVPSDLAWLRSRDLDRAVVDFARSGKPVLGVCGGFQALGEVIVDGAGVEGGAQGLGLLPVVTSHEADKIVRTTSVVAPRLDGFWSPLAGRALCGYEIRTGRVQGEDPACAGGLLGSRENVLGIYLHGIFEDPGVLAALFGGDPGSADPLEESFDRLAALVEENLDMDAVASWVAPDAPSPSPRRHRRLAVLTGGVRSGKSAAAEELARQWGGDRVSYLATAQALDAEMGDRIRAHQDHRPSSWETIEEPLDASAAFGRASHPVVLLDCMGLLATNHLLAGGEEPFRRTVEDLIRAWTESDKDLVVVTNEVGWGIVPDNALSRQFRDQLGWANQRLVASSTEAWLFVAGARIPLRAP